MGAFNINDNPQGLSAIPWLVQGLKLLWKRANGISGGGGGGGTIISGAVLLETKAAVDMVSGAQTLFFTPIDDFVVTGAWVTNTMVVTNGDPQLLPVVSVGWTGLAYNDILNSVPLVGSENTQNFTNTLPLGAAVVIPSGQEVNIRINQAASSGFTTFLANIYLTGFYKGT